MEVVDLINALHRAGWSIGHTDGRALRVLTRVD
jgi:hypothetical protein